MKIIIHDPIFLTLLILALQLTACDKWQSNYEKIEPAHLENLDNTGFSKMTLTEKAVERIVIKTAAITEESIAGEGYREQITRKVVFYGAVIYGAHGETWIYTNPEPLVYLRQEIKIDFVKDGKAYMTEGPPVGTMVVTQGAAELYGTEYHVGH